MARPGLFTRSALRRVAALPLVGLVGCGNGPPQACSLAMLVGSVRVDVSALDVDPRSVGALLCVEDDCGARDPWSEFDPAEGTVSRLDPRVPRRDEVGVRVVLTDPDSGAEVYRGSGAVPIEMVDHNGPGCGETRLLPTVTAEPDGTLHA